MMLAQPAPASEAAFTLNEMMIGAAILVLALGGILMCQWLGMVMTEATNSRVTANDKARRFLSQFERDLQNAKFVNVGTGSLSGFTVVGPNLAMNANAIQINSTTNTNNYIRYYVDAATKTLKRITDATNAATTVVTGVVNTVVFSLQNYSGTILTNNQGNPVVSMNLQIHEWQPTLRQNAGTNQYADYNLHTKVTIRPTP